MMVCLKINGVQHEVPAGAGDSLLKILRSLGLYGAKHGCESGECGACAVLVDGKPINSCLMLAAQADGHEIQTIEALGEHPEQGWRVNRGLHPLQQAFVEMGAIQCGYCTPAQILAAKELLGRNPDPSEDEVREALSGVLCRCTGYVKPVKAVLQAAAVLRGEVNRASEEGWPSPGEGGGLTQDVLEPPAAVEMPMVAVQALPKMVLTPQTLPFHSVGKPEVKVDAVKLAQGKPAFTADMEMRGMLYAKVLHSPLAHARIRHIETTRAKALPGVAAVLTWQDIPRVIYSTAGQSDPIPGPLDSFSLDNKVRFIGDRVAFVAAESVEIAEEALKLIEVEFEPLPTLLDPSKAMETGAPILHDEPEYVNCADSDASRNLAAEIRIDIGDVEKGFAEADQIFEAEYTVPKVQQAHIEPHVTLTYWDEDDRLVIRTSTQVPFHIRQVLAPV
jgi:putative selenate reductase molybdopterin-binding subunit